MPDSLTGPVSPALRVEAPLRNDHPGAERQRKRQAPSAEPELEAESAEEEGNPHALDTKG